MNNNCYKCKGSGEIEICGCGLRGPCDVCNGTGISKLNNELQKLYDEKVKPHSEALEDLANY